MATPMDLDYRNLTKAQIFRKYQHNLDILRKYARDNNIDDDVFDKLVTDNINQMEIPRRNRIRKFLTRMCEQNKRIIYGITVILVVFVFFIFKREISSILLRNIQIYIYPLMKLWRKLSAPLLLFFPSLTGKL